MTPKEVRQIKTKSKYFFIVVYIFSAAKVQKNFDICKKNRTFAAKFFNTHDNEGQIRCFAHADARA